MNVTIPEKRGNSMDEISLKGMFSLALVKKEEYTGSHKGMRFRLCKADDQLQATVYPEPYSWDATPEEQKESEYFALSDEGVEQAVDWLNTMYERKFKRNDFFV
jgi:hypothetical protein